MRARLVRLIGAMLVAIGPVSLALCTPAMPEIVRAFATTEAAVQMTPALVAPGLALVAAGGRGLCRLGWRRMDAGGPAAGVPGG
jgi:hypothetical protein